MNYAVTVAAVVVLAAIVTYVVLNCSKIGFLTFCT